MTHVYDKAKWHYDGDYPKELSIDQAFVHTGMYLGWIIDNQLYSTKFEKEAAADILNFKDRKLTGTQVYMNWAGVLANDMLNKEGNEFSETYYEEEYVYDYGEVVNAVPTLYHVQDTWENYELIKNRIDETYKIWSSKK